MIDPALLSEKFPGEEQERVLEFFNGKNDGVFVDIGALNGFDLSNTRPLWQRGWSGFMIEADSRAFAQLSDNYAGCPRIALLHAAVCDVDGKVFFYENKDTPTWSSMDNWWLKHKGLNRFNGKLVQSFQIGSLPIPEVFDFLNLDVEGLDSLVIESMPKTMRPTLIVAETNKSERGDRIDTALRPRGYRKVWTSELNVAYAV